MPFELDHNRREAAISAGWRAYAERCPGMEAQYRAACDGWNASAIVRDGDVIGALLHKQGVVHIGIVPEWRGRWATKGAVREMLSYGSKTQVLDGEDDAKAFVERLGFKNMGGGQYQRELPCHS